MMNIFGKNLDKKNNAGFGVFQQSPY